MIAGADNLIDRYVAWLREKTSLRAVENGHVEITTPYLDRHNDYLQIYMREEGEKIILSDDGNTIEDLIQSGCSLESPKRQNLLKQTLAGFGIKERNNCLEVLTTRGTFPMRKHDLVQAMLAVNDLFCLAMPMVLSLFFEDVIAWMDSKNIRYVTGAKFTGKSGFDHHFDFVIPKSKSRPERFVETVNAPSPSKAKSLAFKWEDTKEARPAKSEVYAIINDQDATVSEPVLEALRQYEIIPVRWSLRSAAVEDLAA
ncbi:MAG: DUF1829 domain-containing protein [Phycisphaerales bacterium]|nr:DUF1829 domain-containing protein [Phycisphaerales bacterium]